MSDSESRNLGRVIARQADRDSIALIGVNAGQQDTLHSFGEIDDRADALARGLLARGYAPGERIALLGKDKARFSEEIARTEERWLSLSAELEEAERA